MLRTLLFQFEALCVGTGRKREREGVREEGGDRREGIQGNRRESGYRRKGGGKGE